MAEEQDNAQKTEDPSPKRLEEARKKGEVASSREVNTWFLLLGGAIALLMIGPQAAQDVIKALIPFIEKPEDFLMEDPLLKMTFTHLFKDILKALFFPFLILMIAVLCGGFLQTGLNLSLSTLTPKFERISIGSGAKRIFSKKSLGEFAKGILKILVVGSIAFTIIIPALAYCAQYVFFSTPQLLSKLQQLLSKLFLAILSIMAVVAGIDYIAQKYAFTKRLRMSKQELKEEHKESEGDPAIKGRLKQLRAERARGRIANAVPKASVVIVNPMHYAVALQYEGEIMAAPKVIAKGVDFLALKIREIAIDHRIPIIENPPLARALYSGVDIDQEIPSEHYKAVAEIIRYIMNLKKNSWRVNPS